MLLGKRSPWWQLKLSVEVNFPPPPLGEKIHHYFDCQLNSANTLLPLLLLVRYDRFMDAFEHVSQRIDDIYKVTEDYS